MLDSSGIQTRAAAGARLNGLARFEVLGEEYRNCSQVSQHAGCLSSGVFHGRLYQSPHQLWFALICRLLVV